jgi:Tol biopolymer transport system component
MMLCLLMVGNSVRPISAQDQPAQPRQVWTHAGGGGWTISPDGRYIAFPAYDGMTQNLGLHDRVTGSDIRLTHNDNSREYLNKPIFSPDGKQIAFTWHHPPAASEIRVMDVDGGVAGASRVLFKQDEVNSPTLADWSPDGKWIAAGFYRTDRTVQIVLISVADGSVRVLKTVDWAAAYGLVCFSPDNQYLALNRPSGRASKDGDIYLLKIDGGQEIPAVVHPANDRAVGWRPDGQLLYISDRNGSYSLWSEAVDSGKPQGTPQLLLPNFGANMYAYMGATRTGDLYYTALAGSTKIAVATVDWNSGKISTSQEFTQGIQPEWSPDGKSLAFKVLRLVNASLVIQSVETGQSREIQPKMTSFNWPRWSPDRKSFLLQGTDDHARQGIFRMDATTGELQAVTIAGAGEGFGMPQWFPDGKRILYQSRPFSSGKSVKSIRERDLKSGHEREIASGADLADDDAGRLTVVLSPDGRSFAHVREDPATKQGSLNLVSLKEGRTRELVRFGADKQIMVNGWTPDGKSLIYSEREGWVRLSDGHEEPDFATWIVPVEGGAARKIELNEPWARQVRVNPDGKRIAFWIPNNTPEQVWMVENVRPKAPTTFER